MSSKSEFVRLTTKEFKLSQKKINMIRIKALVELGQLPALKEFVLTLNKKNEAIPFEIIFEYIDSRGQRAVSAAHPVLS